MAPSTPSTTRPDALAGALGSSLLHGLTTEEAARRLARDGPNALRAKAPPPRWLRLLRQFRDPMVYLLLAANAVALAAWVADGAVGWPIDAIVIAAVVVINALLGYVQQAKALQAVAALGRMTTVTSTVVRAGMALRIPSAELVTGDVLVLREGDAVGADARLFDAASLRTQEATLTGESEAVLKSIDALDRPLPVGDQVNMVFKGTAVVQGNGRAMVTATGMKTQMGSVATLLDATPEVPTPLTLEMRHIGRTLGIAVLIIAVVVVVTIMLLSHVRTVAAFVEVLLFGVALAVAAVPEGLPTILSVVLALGVQRMAGRKAIIRNLSSVETLGSATVICTDKTGTLTRGEMTIVQVMTASGSVHITGVGYAPEGRIEHEGVALTEGALHAELTLVLGGGSLAGNARLHHAPGGPWSIQGDPTEAAFLVAERKFGIAERRNRRFERTGEIPFTSDRSMMSTIQRDLERHEQSVLVSKGAPDVLLKACSWCRVGKDTLPLDEIMRKRILAEVDQLSGVALRTLGVAYRDLSAQEAGQISPALERGLVYAGTVGMMDPPRAGAAKAIAQAHRAGIRVIMITGDHPHTASRIAADLGITDGGAARLTGPDIDALDDALFAQAVRRTSVYARVSPSHKLRIVAALQADGNVVAMTGDGVNDAPALKAADIGVAMGITGSEVAKESARMILADDNFSTIVAAVREGRAILDNIRKFLRYLLSSNMGEVLTIFLGLVGGHVIGLSTAGGGVVLPLLATQILWMNLITDAAPALAMGIDPAMDDVMARPPRPLKERVIDRRMWAGVIQIGVVVAVCTLLTMDLFLPGGMLKGDGDYATARTAGFTVLVLSSMFNCLNARSETTSAFHHLFVNPWLWGAIATSVLLQVAVVHVGILNTAFSTVPLSFEQWAICIAMASVVLWYSELRKWIVRFWPVRRALVPVPVPVPVT